MGLLGPTDVIIILVFIGVPVGAVCIAVSGNKVMSRTEAFFWGFLFNIIGLIVVLLSKNKIETANFQFYSVPGPSPKVNIMRKNLSY
jgi:hypothetical protein